MKKTAASIALFFYLLVSCGVVVNFHYCMDRLASVQFFKAESKICGKCGMDSDDAEGCCRDEIKVIRMQEDQQQNLQLAFVLQLPDVPINIPSAFIDEPFYNVDEARHWHNHSPPLLAAQDTYLRNCVFRI
jgi:hypothetical protein